MSRQARDDCVAIQHETVDRLANLVVTLVPLALLGFAIYVAWGGTLHWSDLVVLVITYVLTGVGITVGFHRLFTHRSFNTSRLLRALSAVEGPVIEWVSSHRKHHRFSDLPGDPHSPHVDHGVGWRGALRGLFHAHVGWLFIHTERGSKQRFAPDLINDRVVSMIDRTFFLWALVGLAVPFAVGYVLGGTLVAGLTA